MTNHFYKEKTMSPINTLYSYLHTGLKTIGPTIAPAAQFVVEQMPILHGSNPLPSLSNYFPMDERKTLADAAVITVACGAIIGIGFVAKKCIDTTSKVAFIALGITIPAAVYFALSAK